MTLDDLIAQHPAGKDYRFRTICAEMRKTRPNESDAAIIQTAHFVWGMWAQEQELIRAAVQKDRLRITEIVTSVDDPADIAAALRIALTTDHPADVAIAMLERQRAETLS